MSAVLIEPELREVLEDVVRQSPDSSIFKSFTPTRFNRTFDLPDQTISIAQAGLSTAERELIRVHRDKLAWVLREAFLVNFYAGDGADWATVERTPSNPVALQSKAKRTWQSASPDAFRYRTGHYLRRIVNGEPILEEEDLSSLLIASLRLADHSNARLYHAYVDMRSGDLRATWRSLTPLLDSAFIDMAIYARIAWIKALSEAGRDVESQRWSRDSVHFARLHGLDGRALTMAARALFHAATSCSFAKPSFTEYPFAPEEIQPHLMSIANSDWALRCYDSETLTKIRSQWAR